MYPPSNIRCSQAAPPLNVRLRATMPARICWCSTGVYTAKQARGPRRVPQPSDSDRLSRQDFTLDAKVQSLRLRTTLDNLGGVFGNSLYICLYRRVSQ